MAQINAGGHSLVVPDDITSVTVTPNDFGTVDVQWFSPAGEANLMWSDGGWTSGAGGWDGILETTSGIIETAKSDGTFDMTGAYYLDNGDYVNPPDVFVPASLDLGVLAVGHDLLIA